MVVALFGCFGDVLFCDSVVRSFVLPLRFRSLDLNFLFGIWVVACGSRLPLVGCYYCTLVRYFVGVCVYCVAGWKLVWVWLFGMLVVWVVELVSCCVCFGSV